MTASTASRQRQRDTATTPTYLARKRSADGASNPLLEAASPLLDALSQTPAELLDASGMAQHRQWLLHQVQLFGKVCSTLQLPSPQVDKARYCLCSALDEAAGLTAWGNGTATGIEWETNGLASTLGYDRQGCDRVYTIVTECMREPQKNHDLIEVIEQILSRGFKGRYRFAADGEHQIEAVRGDIHDAICANSASLPIAHDTPQASGGYHPLHHLVTELRTETPASGSRRWLAILALGLALLAIAPGVAYRHFSQVKPVAQVVTPIDALTSKLTERLASEIHAGTITLAENAEHTTLTLRLEGIFEAGESTVNPWVEPLIATIGQDIAKTHGRVLVTGHTDDQPFLQSQRSSNLALSDARAQEVLQILVSSGVQNDRIGATGKGNAEPAADNATRQGRTRNRRVEITVSE